MVEIAHSPDKTPPELYLTVDLESVNKQFIKKFLDATDTFCSYHQFESISVIQLSQNIGANPDITGQILYMLDKPSRPYMEFLNNLEESTYHRLMRKIPVLRQNYDEISKELASDGKTLKDKFTEIFANESYLHIFSGQEAPRKRGRSSKIY